MATEASVTFLLNTVKELVESRIRLIAGAEAELKLLQNELRLLQSFLNEAARKQKKEDQFKELERQIRDIVYEAEDVIDTCLTEVAVAEAKKSRNPLRKLGRTSTRADLAGKVKELREKKVKPMFDKATREFATMKISDDAPVEDADSLSMTAARVIPREDNVVGLEDEELKITKFLFDEKSDLDVYSIIGMPGLGKTTLAWKIYQDKTVQFNFPTHIWVYVSQDFRLRDVLLKILAHFTNQDMSRNTDHDLVQTVRNCLKQGKFLLVMDDVWSVQAWEAIERVLPMTCTNGKVLITSRDLEVGQRACGGINREPHQLRLMNEEESWELLQYEAFRKLDVYPSDLEGIGKHIANQCDGLPLAIVVIGGILADLRAKHREITPLQNAWKKVSENVLKYVANDDKGKQVANVVELSYKKLPHELRNSFLYLGLFPEDYEITASTVVRLWIAEGFVQKKTEESLEETAVNNLSILINRNLVMDVKKNLAGEVKSFRVHDVIREFCILKGGINEQNLFREIKMSDKGVSDPHVSEIHKYRRLSIHFRLGEFLAQKNLKGPGVRSFLSFYKQTNTLDAKYIASIPDAFPLLRVLDSKSFKFTHFPPKISKLIHLRYLTLSCKELNLLPDTISELWNLQTLLVDTEARTLDIKANVWKMIQLRHVKTKASILLSGKSEANDKCLNLQTLTRVSPDYCTDAVLSKACNVKRLGIRGNLVTLLDRKHSLDALGSLENLKMVNDVYYGSTSENPLQSLPQSSFFPSTIKKLTVSRTYLSWGQISVLARISCLQVLKLKDGAFMGAEWNVQGDYFRSLQFLLIDNSDFVYWKASAENFPCLGSLELKNCEKLVEIPVELEKSLHKIKLDGVGKPTVSAAKKVKQKREESTLESKLSGLHLEIGPGCE